MLVLQLYTDCRGIHVYSVNLTGGGCTSIYSVWCDGERNRGGSAWCGGGDRPAVIVYSDR